MKIFITQHKTLAIFVILSVAVVILSLFSQNNDSPIKILVVQIAIGFLINFIFYVTLSYLPERRKMIVASKIIVQRINRIIADMRTFPNAMIMHFPFDSTSRKEQIKHATHDFDSKIILEHAGLCLNYSGKTGRWIAEDLVYTKTKRVEENIDFILKYYSYAVKPELDEIFDKILHTGVLTALKTMHEHSKEFSNSSDEFVEYDGLADKLKNAKKCIKDLFLCIFNLGN